MSKNEEISGLLSSCVQRLSVLSFSSESEASAALTASSSRVHLDIDRLMAEVTSTCLDAIKRRTKFLHDQVNEAYCQQLGKVSQVKVWLNRRDQVLAKCHQVATKMNTFPQSDLVFQGENCAKEVALLEKEAPCHPLALDDSDTLALSQKLVDLVMKIGRIQVGPDTDNNFDTLSDCISIGGASSILSLHTNSQIVSVNYAEKSKPVKTFGVKGCSGPEAEKFNSPRGCALLPSGLVAIADAYNDRVKVLDLVSLCERQNLAFNIDRARTIASKQLTFTGLAVESGGTRLFMADGERGCVHVVDVSRIGAASSSNQLSDWPIVASVGSQGFQPKQLNVPMGICLDPKGQHLFICDNKNHQLKLWSLVKGTWEFAQILGDYGKKIGQFVEPSFCTVTDLDATSSLLAVSDSGNNRVQLFKVDAANPLSQGQPLKVAPIRVVGKEGSALGQLSNPRGLAFDAAGNLLVCDAGNRRIHVFSKDGTPVCTFGAAVGLIPEGIALVGENLSSVLVTDRKQHVVHIF